jgi:hypothetical protein
MTCSRLFVLDDCTGHCSTWVAAKAIKVAAVIAGNERFVASIRKGSPMKNVKIVSSVQFPGGGMFRETYEATNLPPEADAILRQQFAAFAKVSADAEHASGGRGTRVCTLDVSVDGVAQPTVSATLTKAELHRVQKHSHKMGADVLDKLHAR